VSLFAFFDLHFIQVIGLTLLYLKLYICHLVFVKVRTGIGPAIFEVPKSPGDFLTLDDKLYHKTYPGHLQVCF
jgi:hypothetical protein